MNFPEHFIASIENTTGFQKDSFIKVHEDDSQITSIRLNENKIAQDASLSVYAKAEKVPWCTSGFYLSERPLFVLDPHWHVGAYYVQEASSMFVDHIVKSIIPTPTGHEVVLDLCAAPGGKTTVLLNHFKESLVIANETIKNRNQILIENLTKWGAQNIIVTQNDPGQFAGLTQFFDLVLVDAPCSGSGLFRRDHEAMKQWSLDHVTHCSIRQKRIVEEIMPSIKEGGFLIYSTCSYSMEEDEQLMHFIANDAEWEPVSIPINPTWGIVETEFENSKGYRFYPNLLKGEGFFVAVFKRKASQYAYQFNQRSTSLQLVNKKLEQQLSSMFVHQSDIAYLQHAELIIGVPSQHLDLAQTISQTLYIKMMGIAMGSFKGQDFIPHHHLAMAQFESIPYEMIDIDVEIALQFLRRSSLPIFPGKGWLVLKFNGLRLGFLKNLTNRSNNYYPNEWRILNY